MDTTPDTTRSVVKSDEQWRDELDADAYAVLRHAATEPPFTGAYVDEKSAGTYRCRGCGAELFDSGTKFDSGTGWPSFTDPMVADAVELKTDTSHGMVRTEAAVRGLRRAPGARLRRRPGRERPALLHQLLRAGPRAAELTDLRPGGLVPPGSPSQHAPRNARRLLPRCPPSISGAGAIRSRREQGDLQMTSSRRTRKAAAVLAAAVRRTDCRDRRQRRRRAGHRQLVERPPSPTGPAVAAPTSPRWPPSSASPRPSSRRRSTPRARRVTRRRALARTASPRISPRHSASAPPRSRRSSTRTARPGRRAGRPLARSPRSPTRRRSSARSATASASRRRPCRPRSTSSTPPARPITARATAAMAAALAKQLNLSAATVQDALASLRPARKA